MNKQLMIRIVGLAIYTLGLALGAALAAGAGWGDFEASTFASGTLTRDEKRLSGFSCPVIMTRGDTFGKVSARLRNPADDPREFTVRASVSRGYVSAAQMDERKVRIDAGDSAALEYAVTPEDAAWKRIVLVRVQVLRNRSLPPRTATCGILLLDTALLSGRAVIAGALAGSLLAMAAGWGMWRSTLRPLTEERLHRANGLAALAGIILLAILFGLIGVYVVDGLLLMVAIIVGASLIFGRFG